MKYNVILQKLLFPLSEIYSRTTIRSKYSFLLESQNWSKKKLEEYQLERIKQLIWHAYQNVPYYTNLMDKLSIRPQISSIKELNKFPPLTKQIIQKNYEGLRAINYKNKSFPKYTSGSTGTPTKFYQTKEDYSWQWAAHFRAWSWAGYELGDSYAKISINDDRSQLRKKIQDTIMRCQYIFAYCMGPDDVKKYVREIIRNKPKFIYGYTSSINILSEYMLKNDMVYEASAVITTGDNLLPSFKNNIEKAFSSKVYDGYGCGGEGLNIMAQCEYGNYHINDELIRTEIIDNEIITTSLNNYAMPLIRYKPNDLVTKANICQCGRNLTTIKSINGRSHDVINTQKGDVLVVHFFTILFEYIKGITQFKIIQNQIEGITIELVVNEHYHKTHDENYIRDYIRKSAGQNFQIEFDYIDQIPLENSGKFKFIDNRIKLEN